MAMSDLEVATVLGNRQTTVTHEMDGTQTNPIHRLRLPKMQAKRRSDASCRVPISRKKCQRE